jgi:hypothetical protein
MSEGDVRCLYDMPKIDGKEIMVFECGRPPENEYGDADLAAFATDTSSTRNVYYEASDMTVKWFKSPFYIGRTPPTHDELVFQLRKWHGERQTKFLIAGAVGIVILYLLFK